MFKKFKSYRPLHIARYVKALFKGTFSVEGIGVFHFDQGKVLLPDLSNKKMTIMMKEINEIIFKQLQLA